jgi:dihydropteroate synthase
MRPVFRWNIGKRYLELGRRTLVMGIVNVTPDSFSDAGRYFRHDDAIEKGLSMLREGADILDIGGESTRPGARVAPNANSGVGTGLCPVPDAPDARPHTRTSSHHRSVPPPSVSTEEELRRVLPVIEGIKRAQSDAVVSIDTYKAEVARRAVEAGAEVVNDVSAFRWDPLMATTVARMPCGAVLMHMRGRPEEWRQLPGIAGEELLALVMHELRECTTAAEQQGVTQDRIVIDPGFGFGKNFFENYPLLAHLGKLHELGYPILSGTSRKSFIGRTIGRAGQTAPPDQRLYGTLATAVASVLQGAHIVRVHDVKPTVDAVAVADAILNGAASLKVNT